jgi:hypothetical protein
MIRTFSLVVLLTLLAGAAMGFFVAHAAAREAIPQTGDGVDLVIEHKVRAYREGFRLTSAQEQEVREAFREYDARLAALFRRCQREHQAEFEALARTANERIEKVTRQAERR